MTPTKAGIYCRISSDRNGEALGVARQLDACTEYAERNGWTVRNTYQDNDVSATRAKRRPQYERMMKDAREGVIDGVIVWDVDRLTRKPRELEDVIDLAEKHGVSLATVNGGRYDLGTTNGRMQARMLGTVARFEAEHMADRIRAKQDELARDGKPHGFIPYGYQRHDGIETLDPGESAVIRDAIGRLLAGESLRSVTAALNDAGTLTRRGNRWTSKTLRDVLLRERNAGLRVHRGKVVGKGDWPAIIDEDTHRRVVALLTDPNRRKNRGETLKYLLSGIARCGRCGGSMVVNVGNSRPITNRDRQRKPAYVCKECYRVTRNMAKVDEVVEGVVLARLARPDALSALVTGDADAAECARNAADELEARLSLAADEFAEGNITADQLRRITGKLRPQIDAERAKVTAALASPELAAFTGPDVAARWDGAVLDVKRRIIEMLCSITILPAGRGARFDPELIRIEWRQG